MNHHEPSPIRSWLWTRTRHGTPSPAEHAQLGQVVELAPWCPSSTWSSSAWEAQETDGVVHAEGACCLSKWWWLIPTYPNHIQVDNQWIHAYSCLIIVDYGSWWFVSWVKTRRISRLGSGYSYIPELDLRVSNLNLRVGFHSWVHPREMISITIT